MSVKSRRVSMETIDFKDLILNFTSNPIETLQSTFTMVMANGWENKWRILVIIISWYIGRWLLFKAVSSMIPTPNNKTNKVGHVLRKIFLRSVTDDDGRLLSRTSRWFKKGETRTKVRATSRNLPLDKYSEGKNEAYYSRRTERAAGAASLLKSCLNFILFMLIGLMVFAQLGITISGETAGWLFGFVSIALALGVQNLVKDTIGGVHVIAEDQYGLGDYISTSTGVAGIVTHIGLRTTRLKGEDGTIYHIRHSEMSTIGNRTQANGTIILDTKFTWNDPSYDDKPMVNIDEYNLAESMLIRTIKELRSTLNAVNRVSLNERVENNEHVSIERIAEVLPVIAPNLTDDTLTDLKIVTDPESEDSHETKHAKVAHAINKIEEKKKPIFKNIEIVGLVESEAKSLTIRLKVHLTKQASLANGLNLLRMKIFEVFSEKNISVQFSEVPSTLTA